MTELAGTIEDRELDNLLLGFPDLSEKGLATKLLLEMTVEEHKAIERFAPEFSMAAGVKRFIFDLVNWYDKESQIRPSEKDRLVVLGHVMLAIDYLQLFTDPKRTIPIITKRQMGADNQISGWATLTPGLFTAQTTQANLDIIKAMAARIGAEHEDEDDEGPESISKTDQTSI